MSIQDSESQIGSTGGNGGPGAKLSAVSYPSLAVGAPTEVKAQALALHVAGYSCRNIEKQLKAKFPNENIPNYGTIHKWVRKLSPTRPTPFVRRFRNMHTVLHWWEVARMAADKLGERMLAELEAAPYEKIALMYGRAVDMAIKLERLNNQDTSNQR